MTDTSNYAWTIPKDTAVGVEQEVFLKLCGQSSMLAAEVFDNTSPLQISRQPSPAWSERPFLARENGNRLSGVGLKNPETAHSFEDTSAASVYL